MNNLEHIVYFIINIILKEDVAKRRALVLRWLDTTRKVLPNQYFTKIKRLLYWQPGRYFIENSLQFTPWKKKEEPKMALSYMHTFFSVVFLRAVGCRLRGSRTWARSGPGELPCRLPCPAGVQGSSGVRPRPGVRPAACRSSGVRRSASVLGVPRSHRIQQALLNLERL